MWEFLPAMFTIGSSLLQYSGNNKSADAARAGGQRVQAADIFQAQQYDQSAGQAVASAQLASLDEQRKARLLASRALAVAAASGAGATDPTITRIISGIAGEGAYRGAVALYQGDERARMLRMQAEAKRYEGQLALESGEAKADAYETAGIGSLLKGAGSLFAKYGMGSAAAGGAAGTDIAAGGFLDAGTTALMVG